MSRVIPPQNEAKRKAETELNTYLKESRVEGGAPFTHTTKVPASKYFVDKDDSIKFFTIYNNAVVKGVVPTLTERPGLYGPLRFDFDFKFSLDDGLKRKYTDDILKSVINIIYSELKDAAVNIEDNLILGCGVLEKKGPRAEEGKGKDGLHLHFPKFICEGWFQDEYMRSKLNERMVKEKIWEGVKLSEPVEKLVDTGMAKKPWLMYGSSKGLGAEPYLLTRMFVPSKKGDPVTIPLETYFAEEMEGRKCKLTYYLPKFLSIQGYSEDDKIELKPEVESKKTIFRTRKARRAIVPKKRSMDDVLEDIKTIKEGGIMDMLSDERADDYDPWMDVGWTLFNIGQGCEEALDLWVGFSRRSSKFVDGECEERWAKMELRDKTIGSLLAMARSDNPDAYKAWKDMNIRNKIDRCLYEEKPNEWEVAQVIHKLYKDRFICADPRGDGVWYEFSDHRWKEDKNAVTLKKLFATEVVELFVVYKADLAKQEIGKDENARGKLEAKETKCRKITTSLKEVVFQKKLLEMCKLVFYDPLFLKKVDENKKLFVCANGVLDLELMLFRDGRPDDYCTLSCNTQYPKDASWDDDGVIEVSRFLEKVFPDPELRKYFLNTACAAMEGGNVNKNFIVGTGTGDNSKSVTYSFLEDTFGEYCIKFPRDMFIGKSNQSGGPRPELSRVRGRRLAIVSEIAKTETLNIGVVKELTGNDSFFARGMYEKGTEIKPMFTLFMQCNEPPKVPGHDQATWNRIRVLEYESKFVKQAELHLYPVPDTKEEQFAAKRFHADNQIILRLKELCPEFLWMLFENYKNYKKTGLKEPTRVFDATREYKNRNDVYAQFVGERIKVATQQEKDEDINKTKYFLKLTDLYAEFSSWYKLNHESYAKEKLNKIEVQHEFNKKFPGHSTKIGRSNGWYGYSIIPDEESGQSIFTTVKPKVLTKESKNPIPGTTPISIVVPPIKKTSPTPPKSVTPRKVNINSTKPKTPTPSESPKLTPRKVAIGAVKSKVSTPETPRKVQMVAKSIKRTSSKSKIVKI